MIYVDRALYWFLTRTPAEKAAILFVILSIIVVGGMIIFSTLATIFGGLNVAMLSGLAGSPLFLMATGAL